MRVELSSFYLLSRSGQWELGWVIYRADLESCNPISSVCAVSARRSNVHSPRYTDHSSARYLTQCVLCHCARGLLWELHLQIWLVLRLVTTRMMQRPTPQQDRKPASNCSLRLFIRLWLVVLPMGVGSSAGFVHGTPRGSCERPARKLKNQQPANLAAACAIGRCLSP